MLRTANREPERLFGVGKEDMKLTTRTSSPLLWLVGAACVALSGCGPDGAPQAQRALLDTHVPRVKEVVHLDRQRTRTGIVAAAARLAPGFRVEDPDSRERQMRRALTLVQEPPRGIPEFISSPISFLAVIGVDGIAVCRDGLAEHDRMKGQNLSERFEVVRNALTGEVGYQLGEFGSEDQGGTTHTMLFAAPMFDAGGTIVGAALAGIPLWREAQRISGQLRIELAEEINEGMVLWVSLYDGDELIPSPNAPTEIVAEVPSLEERNAGFARSPGGFTGQTHMFRQWYGYAVVPLPTIGENIGMVVHRSEPEE